MDWVWNPWALPAMVVVLGAWLMATIVFVTRPDRSQNRLLAAYLVLESFAFLWLSVLPRLVGTEPTAYATSGTGYFVWPWVMVFYLLFLSTLNTPMVTPLRWRSTRIGIFLLGAIASMSALMWPRLWHKEFVNPWFGGFGGSGDTILNQSLFAWALLVSLFALAAAISSLRRAPPHGPSRTQARAFVTAFAFRDSGMVLFAISALAVGAALGVGRFSVGDLVLLFLWPFSVTMMHIFLALGILRAQLFDIDLKIKWTINKSTLVAVFVGVFFVSAQVAQAFLTTEYGWAIGGVVAGLLLLAINPLQRFAAHIADTAMPNVHDSEEHRTIRKHEVYQAALEEALADGELSSKDRSVLAALQDHLGITAKEALHLERTLAHTKGVA